MTDFIKHWIRYNNRCDGIISADTYKVLVGESENKLKQINESIENGQVKNYKIKVVFYQIIKKVKRLLGLNKLKKELIDTLIDRIVIDKDRNITIKYKYDVVPEVVFKYENRNLARNTILYFIFSTRFIII